MSAIAHLHQRPRCTNDNTPAGYSDAVSTCSCRPRQKTSTDGNGIVKSHPTHHPTSSSRLKSGQQMNGVFRNHERDPMDEPSKQPPRGWNTVDDQTLETSRTRAMRGILRHPISGISDVDPHGTIGGHPACIATTGATRDEGQEEQCCEPSGGPVSARQIITERQRVNTLTESAERVQSSTDCDPGGRQRCVVLRRMREKGNRWQRIPLTMVARESKTKLNNRTVLASTGKRPVEMERPCCPHGHGSLMMQATPQQSLYWECSTCSTTPGLSLNGCDVRLVNQRIFEGVEANMVPIGEDKTPCF